MNDNYDIRAQWQNGPYIHKLPAQQETHNTKVNLGIKYKSFYLNQYPDNN